MSKSHILKTINDILKEKDRSGEPSPQSIYSKMYSKIKPFIFEEVSLQPQVTNTLNEYLFENYPYFHPRSRIVSKYLDVITKGNQDLVFYKTNSDVVYHLYKGRIIINSGERSKYHSSNIKYIRGSLDINQLLTEARNYTRPKNEHDLDEWVYYGRFSIQEYFGQGKINVSNKHRDRERELVPSNANEVTSIEDDDSISLYKTELPLNYKSSDIIESKATRYDPFKNLFYSKDIMSIISELNQWLKNKSWFLERNLPWKRGYLIHGPGGTGKSSLASSIGQKFGIPVHQLYLSNMSDYEFKSAWDNAVASTPSIVLLEDFDSVFNKRVAVNPESTLSFDTVLNTISGVKDANGIILIITTNHIDKIDDAIGVSVKGEGGISSRPGRIDKIIYLGAMETDMRRKLITKILRDWPELIDDALNNTDGYTAAQVQEYCIQRALEKLHG